MLADHANKLQANYATSTTAAGKAFDKGEAYAARLAKARQEMHRTPKRSIKMTTIKCFSIDKK
jgi:hypothetical protein